MIIKLVEEFNTRFTIGSAKNSMETAMNNEVMCKT